MTRSGCLRAARSSAVLAGRREVDVVAARAEVGAERAQDLRLVVDDEDPGHCAALSRTTTVSPPPGVSSSSIEPPIASTKPSRDRQAEPDALVGGSSRRGAGTAGTCASRSAAGTPGPRSTIADVDAAVDRAGDDARPGSRRASRRRRWRRCWRARARAGPASAMTGGSVFGQSSVDARRRGRRGCAARRGRPRRGRSAAASTLERAGLEAAHVEQVADERVEAVGLLVDRREELVAARPPSSRRPAAAGSSPTP